MTTWASEALAVLAAVPVVLVVGAFLYLSGWLVRKAWWALRTNPDQGHKAGAYSVRPDLTLELAEPPPSPPDPVVARQDAMINRQAEVIIKQHQTIDHLTARVTRLRARVQRLKGRVAS